MKRAHGHGLILSIILNMLFRAYWLVLVCILIILHFVFGWPLWLIVIPIVCWFLHSLIITLVLGWANSSVTDSPKPVQENKNPYSARKDPVQSGPENRSPYSSGKDPVQSVQENKNPYSYKKENDQ